MQTNTEPAIPLTLLSPWGAWAFSDIAPKRMHVLIHNFLTFLKCINNKHFGKREMFLRILLRDIICAALNELGLWLAQAVITIITAIKKFCAQIFLIWKNVGKTPFASVKGGRRNLLLNLVKVGSVTAEIFLIWTNVARANVAQTNVIVTVGICLRWSQELIFKVLSKSG